MKHPILCDLLFLDRDYSLATGGESVLANILWQWTVFAIEQ